MQTAAKKKKLTLINIDNIQGTLAPNVYTEDHTELFRKPIATGKSKGVFINL